MEKINYYSHLLLNARYSLLIKFAISMLIYYTFSNNTIIWCMQENNDNQLYIDEINRLKRKVNEQYEYIEKSNNLNKLFAIIIRHISNEPKYIPPTLEERAALYKEHLELIDRLQQNLKRCDYDCDYCYDARIREAQEQTENAWNQIAERDRDQNI